MHAKLGSNATPHVRLNAGEARLLLISARLVTFSSLTGLNFHSAAKEVECATRGLIKIGPDQLLRFVLNLPIYRG